MYVYFIIKEINGFSFEGKNIVMCNGTKWVACWGNATSITDRRECSYARGITLRYPILMCFDGHKLRFHFSNITGCEDVNITKAYVNSTCITFGGNISGIIPKYQEIVSDEIDIEVHAGEVINVSMYFDEYTRMDAGTLVTGPLSKGSFAYGDYAEVDDFPKEISRSTNWFYFLNTIDVLTSQENRAIICYGDSITAQAWPDYLQLRAIREGYTNVSIIRRAISGTRILREYNCITYAAYGRKGEVRFPIEAHAAGADTVIIQHGINDIIHPVGEDVNIFRPMSDLPTAAEMAAGVKKLYVDYARSIGLKVWSATLLPIYGWRTYEPFREDIRAEYNEWLRSSSVFDGCIDFDKAVRDIDDPKSFARGYDSGDHLHPSDSAYEAMAECVPTELLIHS